MKKFLSKTLVFIGILSLVLGTLSGFSTNIIYAEDLELIGTDLGLEIEPSNTRLFNLNNLNPGDTEEGTLTIRNNYNYAFQLFMTAERESPIPLEEGPDLFKQLILSVFLDDVEVYSGPMNDFATTSVDLGRFLPNDSRDLKAFVHIPGPDTGNEFQGESLEVRWIFIAQADQPTPDPDPTPDPQPEPPDEPIEEEELEEIDEDVPEAIPADIPEDLPEEDIIEEEIPQGAPLLPRTGEISSFVYYGIGALFIALGFRINKKKD